MEAHEELGWSVFKFDSRVEEFIANKRRKAKKTAEKTDYRALLAPPEEGKTGPASPSGKKQDDDDDEVEIPHYGSGAAISFVSGDNRVMAHGTIIDDEPALDELAAVMPSMAGTLHLWLHLWYARCYVTVLCMLSFMCSLCAHVDDLEAGLYKMVKINVTYK